MLFAFTFARSFALVELGEKVGALARRRRLELGHACHILLLFGEQVALELLELARLLVDDLFERADADLPMTCRLRVQLRLLDNYDKRQARKIIDV